MENDEVKDYELDEDALEEGDGYRVKLDSFEGPLDLLLHLIKRSKIRICDIFVSDITGQFLEFIERDIDDVDLDKASEFLGMAAYLLEIKAKSLLPKPETAQAGEQEDDGSELMRRLEEYELYKAETEKLKTRAVSLTFDKLLAEKSEKFALLCKVFAGGRGFGKLTDVLQKSYEKAIVRADFNAFLRELPSRYDEEHFARLAEEVRRG